MVVVGAEIPPFNNQTAVGSLPQHPGVDPAVGLADQQVVKERSDQVGRHLADVKTPTRNRVPGKPAILPFGRTPQPRGQRDPAVGGNVDWTPFRKRPGEQGELEGQGDPGDGVVGSSVLFVQPEFQSGGFRVPTQIQVGETRLGAIPAGLQRQNCELAAGGSLTADLHCYWTAGRPEGNQGDDPGFRGRDHLGWMVIEANPVVFRHRMEVGPVDGDLRGHLGRAWRHGLNGRGRRDALESELQGVAAAVGIDHQQVESTTAVGPGGPLDHPRIQPFLVVQRNAVQAHDGVAIEVRTRDGYRCPPCSGSRTGQDIGNFGVCLRHVHAPAQGRQEIPFLYQEAPGTQGGATIYGDVKFSSAAPDMRCRFQDHSLSKDEVPAPEPQSGPINSNIIIEALWEANAQVRAGQIQVRKSRWRDGDIQVH